MRFIGKAAIAAIVSLSALAPVSVSAQEYHRVAVVDVAYIFKNHPGIKAQVEKVEANLKAYDAQLKAKREELQQAAEQLKTFKVGSPDYSAQEERVASLESKLRLDMGHLPFPKTLLRNMQVSRPGVEPDLRASRARVRIQHTPRTC